MNHQCQSSSQQDLFLRFQAERGIIPLQEAKKLFSLLWGNIWLWDQCNLLHGCFCKSCRHTLCNGVVWAEYISIPLSMVCEKPEGFHTDILAIPSWHPHLLGLVSFSTLALLFTSTGIFERLQSEVSLTSTIVVWPGSTVTDLTYKTRTRGTVASLPSCTPLSNVAISFPTASNPD